MSGTLKSYSDSEGIDFNRMADEGPLPIMVLDRDLRFVYANRAYMDVTNKTREELDGAYMFDIFPDVPERQDHVEAMFRKTLAGESTRLDAFPYELRLPDGTTEVRTWQCVQDPYWNAAGEVTHLVQRAEDITARAELKRQNDIISEELDHRVKNLFSVVMATARISGAMATSTEGFVKEFNQRLISMSRVYSRLSNNDWHGLTLRSLFEEELETILGKSSDRYSLHGEDVALGTKSTKDAALIIHELATNAVKYGCFKDPAGRLDIRWSVKDGMLETVWTESGLSGIRPSDREGFGTALFQMMPNVELDRVFRNEGIRVSLKVPVLIATDGVEFS